MLSQAPISVAAISGAPAVLPGTLLGLLLRPART